MCAKKAVELEFNSESFWGHKQHLKLITGKNSPANCQGRQLNGGIEGNFHKTLKL